MPPNTKPAQMPDEDGDIGRAMRPQNSATMDVNTDASKPTARSAALRESPQEMPDEEQEAAVAV